MRARMTLARYHSAADATAAPGTMGFRRGAQRPEIRDQRSRQVERDPNRTTKFGSKLLLMREARTGSCALGMAVL